MTRGWTDFLSFTSNIVSDCCFLSLGVRVSALNYTALVYFGIYFGGVTGLMFARPLFLGTMLPSEGFFSSLLKHRLLDVVLLFFYLLLASAS